MTDYSGQIFGNYRLVQYLATGAFSDVYRGEHIHLHTLAVIKLLRSQLTEDQIGLFRTEASIIASLIHPNIIRIIDFDVKDITPFLVMDYAPHGDMRQRYRRGEYLPLSTIVTYVEQVADALQFAHNQGFIHGQVQPSNMLLGRNDEVLLNHFRFRQGTDLSLISPKYDAMGTPPVYRAPELYVFEGQLSQASDQYALGAVIYEWLCGEPLFSRYSPIDRMVMTLKFEIPTLREIKPTISPQIEQVVLRALAPKPDERFLSIQEFVNAFEQAYQKKHFLYDVALSYAHEDRAYATDLANILKSRGVKVFYDQYEKPFLWGKDLYAHLSDLYQNKAQYCLVFVSKYYESKVWTKVELQSAQARALRENEEYILPIRLARYR